MEEKTPVGSNAPIEESTEKKTSPAPAAAVRLRRPQSKNLLVR